MTKEEIIIDGVDVSKCEHFLSIYNNYDFTSITTQYNCCGATEDKKCKQIKKCYYKQLQRLNIIHKNTIEAYTKEIKELKLKIRLLKKNLKEE